MHMIDRDAFLRERALMMARSDWTYGRITEDRIFEQARRYEAYLRGAPILATDSSATPTEPQSETTSHSIQPIAIRSRPCAPR